MKRFMMGVLAVLMVFSAGVPTAYAASHGCRQDKAQACIQEKTCIQNSSCVSACNFVDSDEDGICDNCDNHCTGCGEMRDENCDGICDNCGTCSHYVDENGDGVCDLQEACRNKTENANCANTGRKYGHHGTRH